VQLPKKKKPLLAPGLYRTVGMFTDTGYSRKQIVCTCAPAPAEANHAAAVVVDRDPSQRLFFQLLTLASYLHRLLESYFTCIYAEKHFNKVTIFLKGIQLLMIIGRDAMEGNTKGHIYVLKTCHVPKSCWSRISEVFCFNLVQISCHIFCGFPLTI
jgi:hypothetical protein